MRQTNFTNLIVFLAIFLTLGCGKVSLLSSESVPKLTKPTNLSMKSRTELRVLVTSNTVPQPNRQVSISRSVSGIIPAYNWTGVTGANGVTEIEITLDESDPLGRIGIAGYYSARLINLQTQEVIDEWNSIPINGEDGDSLILPIDGKPYRVTPQLAQLLSAPELIEVNGQTYFPVIDGLSHLIEPRPGGLRIWISLHNIENALLPSGIKINKAWIINGGEIWEPNFRPTGYNPNPSKDSLGLHELGVFADGGPGWKPNTRVDVIVEIEDINGKKYLLKASEERGQTGLTIGLAFLL